MLMRETRPGPAIITNLVHVGVGVSLPQGESTASHAGCGSMAQQHGIVCGRAHLPLNSGSAVKGHAHC
jgi:hypothetical protein